MMGRTEASTPPPYVSFGSHTAMGSLMVLGYLGKSSPISETPIQESENFIPLFFIATKRLHLIRERKTNLQDSIKRITSPKPYTHKMKL